MAFRLKEGSFRGCLVANFLIERIGQALQDQSIPGGGYNQLPAEALALFNQNPLGSFGHVIALNYKARQFSAFLSTSDVKVEVLNAIVQILLAHRRPNLILPDALKVIRREYLAKDTGTCIESWGFHRVNARVRRTICGRVRIIDGHQLGQQFLGSTLPGIRDAVAVFDQQNDRYLRGSTLMRTGRNSSIAADHHSIEPSRERPVPGGTAFPFIDHHSRYSTESYNAPALITSATSISQKFFGSFFAKKNHFLTSIKTCLPAARGALGAAMPAPYGA